MLALIVIDPLVHPHVVGLLGVTVFIVVTSLCAVTVKFPIPLHPAVVHVTAYTPVHETFIVVPVAPLLHTYPLAPFAVNVVVP